MSKFKDGQGYRPSEIKTTPETELNKEYNYEEGVEKVLQMIEGKLAAQNIITVAFNSTGVPNLGKTTLSARIQNELRKKGIPSKDIETVFNNNRPLPPECDGQNKFVIILSCTGGHSNPAFDITSIALKRQASEQGFDQIKGVDIWIKLDRPDKPAPKDRLGDIHIRNELAKDDPRKITG